MGADGYSAERMVASPGGRRRLIITAVLAYATIETLSIVIAVLARPAQSGWFSALIGAFIGALLWWLVLAIFTSQLRRRGAK